MLYNVYVSLTIERECSFAVGHRRIIYYYNVTCCCNRSPVDDVFYSRRTFIIVYLYKCTLHYIIVYD